MSYTPPPKRLKVVSKQNRSISVVVLRLSRVIHEYLNVQELLPFLLIPGLEFLNTEERKFIQELCDINKPSGFLATRVLSFLKEREGTEGGDDDFRKFIACVERASDHRGHKELTKIFQEKLPKEEWVLIQDYIDEADTPLPSPYVTPQSSPAHRIIIESPERPIALILLQGQLKEGFSDMDRKLWLSFSRGSYDDLECLIRTVQDGKYDLDCKVVALWFESLIMMHRHAEYDDAIGMLDSALDLSRNCVNETILVGRILQRKAQIYLMKGEKTLGAEHFKKAKEKLQFVGRGYDKTNMYCREAKLLSATEPHRRDDIEKIYQEALGTLEQDDPYFLASFPSVTLSKAAFHLHFAFGSKLAPNDRLPTVSLGDVQKARETLEKFNEDEHILIDMRRYEYDLVQAELCRLEGREDEARSRFTGLMCDAGRSKMGNIASIAEHRLKWIPQMLTMGPCI